MGLPESAHSEVWRRKQYLTRQLVQDKVPPDPVVVAALRSAPPPPSLCLEKGLSSKEHVQDEARAPS
jgi:hypothetical protein